MRKGFPLVLLLLAFGCARLNNESTVSLKAGESKETIVDGISRAQTVHVNAKAETGKFSVYVYLEKDKDEAEKVLFATKPGDKVIAYKEKVDEAQLDAAIPAKEAFIVLVVAEEMKKAEVKLKLTN